MHSNGNAFIFPFNGRRAHDVEFRRPKILPIFTEIANEAPFPSGTLKGTSQQVMSIIIGGDQDDWALDEHGIPSVTAEIGATNQFVDDWQLVSVHDGNSICAEQSKWIEHIFGKLPYIHGIVKDARVIKDYKR